MNRRNFTSLAASPALLLGAFNVQAEPIRIRRAMDSTTTTKEAKSYRDLFAALRSSNAETVSSYLLQADIHGRYLPTIEREIARDLGRPGATQKSIEKRKPAAFYIYENYRLRRKEIDAASVPLQSRCIHHSSDFLLWHRAYLYYFERHARKLVGEDFCLPYWRWETELPPSIPPVLMGEAAFSCKENPLCTKPRENLDKSYIKALSSALDNRYYFSSGESAGFGEPGTASNGTILADSRGVEMGVHGAIHSNLGGWMSDPNGAAFDPIFWLFHANLDRLFNQWMLSPGRFWSDDRSAAWIENWLNGKFASFYDVDGQLHEVNRGFILNQANLGYRYDTDPESNIIPMPTLPAKQSEANLTLRRKTESLEIQVRSRSAMRPFVFKNGTRGRINITVTHGAFARLKQLHTLLRNGQQLSIMVDLSDCEIPEGNIGSIDVLASIPGGTVELLHGLGSIHQFGFLDSAGGRRKVTYRFKLADDLVGNLINARSLAIQIRNESPKSNGSLLIGGVILRVHH